MVGLYMFTCEKTFDTSQSLFLLTYFWDRQKHESRGKCIEKTYRVTKRRVYVARKKKNDIWNIKKLCRVRRLGLMCRLLNRK